MTSGVKRAKTKSASPATKKVKKEPASSVKGSKKAANGVVKKEPVDPTVKRETKKQTKTPKATKTTKTTKNAVKQEAKEAKIKEEEIKKEDTPDGTEEPEEDDVYRWWEDINNKEDNSVKWETLEHNGVLFPPPYEPLPPKVKLIYDGKMVSLPVEAEEVAGFFGAMLNSGDHCNNPVFQANFFEDFKAVLEKSGEAKDLSGNVIDIAEFSKMDFSKIFEYYDDLRNQKKAMTRAEKKLAKEERDQAEEPFKFCKMDGRTQPVGNFRIEPPALFRGRGAHPKTGRLKARVQPEQVIINIGKDSKIPEPPAGHQWAEVRHDNTVTWLAHWKENINGNSKYVMLAQSSHLKGISDYNKFEKARELKSHIEVIRDDYTKNLKDKLMLNRQRATATYLIDKFALRAGGEKGEDEADTVGCCSLRYEHVELVPPNKVIFDFLGKDSIRFHQEVDVDRQVFKNLMIFKKPPKRPGDDIFDRLDPSILNKHFQNYMPGLTAKVFRTYNASKTMQDQIDLIPNQGTVNEKVVAFNAANRTVAILCNHQRSIPKTFEASVHKVEEKLMELQWNRIRLKKMLLQKEPKLKKKKGDFFDELDDLTKDQMREIHERILTQTKERIERKFARDNEKLAEEKQKPMPKSELDKRLETWKELKQEYAKELKSGKPELKSGASVERLEKQIAAIDQRIINTQLSLKDKEDNSQVSLGTSKMNYIDPRLTVMFAKKFDVPIEKLFTKTLREKFKWAIQSADENWRF